MGFWRKRSDPDDPKSLIIKYESPEHKRRCRAEEPGAFDGYWELLRRLREDGSEGLPILLSVLRNSSYPLMRATAASRLGQGCEAALEGNDPAPYTREEAEEQIYPALLEATESGPPPVRAAALEALFKHMASIDRDRINDLVTMWGDRVENPGLHIRCCRLMGKTVPQHLQETLIARYYEDDFADSEERMRHSAMMDMHGRGMTEPSTSEKLNQAATRALWDGVLKVSRWQPDPVVEGQVIEPGNPDGEVCHICGRSAHDHCKTCSRPICPNHGISGHVELYRGTCHTCWHKEASDDTPPP